MNRRQKIEIACDILGGIGFWLLTAVLIILMLAL